MTLWPTSKVIGGVCVCVCVWVIQWYPFTCSREARTEIMRVGGMNNGGWSVNGLFIDVYLFFNRKDEFVVDCGRPSEALASVSRSRIPNRRTGGRCYSLDWCFR